MSAGDPSLPRGTPSTEQRARLPALERLHVLLMLAVFVVLPWLIAPGQTEPDTKIDLTITPWRYLGRSLDAWNNHAGLGELQNQAYGYLFPMGPIFGICRSLQIPAWATQRIWWTVLLVVSFLGAQLLIRRLGVATTVPSIVGGAAYALAPRMLTVLPVISIEAWPMALAPWLVLAVLPLTRRDQSRAESIRALALAGVLTAALGGVNATASGIVLVLPFVFLLTNRVGRRRLPIWVVAVVLGASWWLLPLLVLGRYAYPFLDYIETASITTAVTSVPNVFRGADDWIAYILDSADHPVWQGGWVLAQSVTAIIATGAVAAVGCWGVLRQRGHLARWTVWCAVGAIVFMSLGHAGTFGSPVAQQVRALLDGSLAPLRNVHKADPILRLPLAIGVAAVVQRVSASARARDRFVPAALALVVAVAATPIWQGRVGAADAYGAVPQAWTQVAHEIDSAAAAAGGSTMLLPNSRTATYTWGSATDEPLSAIATSPVVTREAAPLGIPGSTRILDMVDQLAASGVPQPSLAAGLARLGIRRLVLRRDLAPSVQARSWQAEQQTLQRSPGFRRVATYGSGTQALTVYDVTGPRDLGASFYASGPVTVAGGPEALFDLYAAGLLSPEQWMRLDPATSGHADVVTDTMPWRAYNNGVPTALAYSPVLTRQDTEPTRIGARDLPPATDPAVQPARQWIGWTGVQVSSSAADPFARYYLGVRDGAAAAFDGDPSTAWLTGDHRPDAWLRGTLRPTSITGVTVQLAGPRQHAVLPATLQVAVGTHTVQVAVRGRSTITVPVAAAHATAIEVRLTAPTGAVDPVLGIVQMRVGGIRLGSVVDIPQPVDLSTQTLLLARLPEDGATITRRARLAGANPVAGTVWARSTGAPLPATCGAAGSVTIRDTDGRTTRIPLQRKGTTATAAGAWVETTTCATGSAGAAVTGPAHPQSATVTLAGAHGLTPELATFGTQPAASGGAREVTSVTGDAGRRVIRLAAGPAGVVALSEGFNAGWHATDGDGRALQPVEVDGWRQGFRVQRTGVDAVTLRFTPTTPQRLGLLLGGALALGLLLAFLAAAYACRRGRRTVAQHPAIDARVPARDDHQPAPGGSARRLTGPAAAVAVGFLVAGPAGILAGLAAAITPRRWWRHVAAASLIGSCVALAFFGVVDAQSTGAAAGQLLATLTLAVLARAGCAIADAPAAAPVAPPATRTPTRSGR